MPKRKRHAELKRKQAVSTRHREEIYGQRVTTNGDPKDLLSRLTSDTRDTPLVLISQTDDGATYTDPFKAADLGAEVWVIDRDSSFVISDTFGRELTAYDGASRIFPVGTAWQGDPHVSPRFLATEEWQREAQERNLLECLEAMLRPAPSPAPVPSGGPGVAADPGFTQLRTLAEGEELAASLLDANRTQPVVVITISRGAERPYVDPVPVAKELRDIAPVFVMATGAVTWAFSDLLPDSGDVYGGASRVYPPGNEWVRDVYQVPLHFAQNTDEGEAVGKRLIADALRWAEPSQHQTMQFRHTVDASGTVTGIVAGQALIKLTSGDLAHSWPELVAQNVPVERVFTAGQRVSGSFDYSNRKFLPRRRSAGEALAGVGVGDVVLARVVEIKAEVCTVEPYPEFRVDLAPEHVVPSSPGVDLRTVVAPGEILPMEVVACGEDESQWRLIAVAEDAEDTVTARAASLLPGGPPWLVESQPELDPEPVPVFRPAPKATKRKMPAVAAHDEDENSQLREENRHLLAQVKDQSAEITKLRSRAEQQQVRITKLTREKGQRRGSDCEAARILERDLHLFSDPADQLRFEVKMAWLRRFSEPERNDTRRLMSWRVGEDFFESWNQVKQGIERSKVVDVIVEVLTDLAPSLTSREVHQLRTGPGGDDPVRTRGDQIAWRVSLQVNTPSARRLHYWRGPEGIELASIRLHDDYRT